MEKQYAVIDEFLCADEHQADVNVTIRVIININHDRFICFQSLIQKSVKACSRLFTSSTPLKPVKIQVKPLKMQVKSILN